MITPEAIYEKLKHLPASDLERAAEFIGRLHAANRQERISILRRTHGSLTDEEADDIERAVEEGCEQIDAEKW